MSEQIKSNQTGKAAAPLRSDVKRLVRPKWKDKTKRYDIDEITSSEIRLGRFLLLVHRHIHYPPDTWLASCPGLFMQIELASNKLDEAKCQAKAKVQVILEDAIKDIVEA